MAVPTLQSLPEPDLARWRPGMAPQVQEPPQEAPQEEFVGPPALGALQEPPPESQAAPLVEPPSPEALELAREGPARYTEALAGRYEKLFEPYLSGLEESRRRVEAYRQRQDFILQRRMALLDDMLAAIPQSVELRKKAIPAMLAAIRLPASQADAATRVIAAAVEAADPVALVSRYVAATDAVQRQEWQVLQDRINQELAEAQNSVASFHTAMSHALETGAIPPDTFARYYERAIHAAAGLDTAALLTQSSMAALVQSAAMGQRNADADIALRTTKGIFQRIQDLDRRFEAVKATLPVLTSLLMPQVVPDDQVGERLDNAITLAARNRPVDPQYFAGIGPPQMLAAQPGVSVLVGALKSAGYTPDRLGPSSAASQLLVAALADRPDVRKRYQEMVASGQFSPYVVAALADALHIAIRATRWHVAPLARLDPQAQSDLEAAEQLLQRVKQRPEISGAVIGSALHGAAGLAAATPVDPKDVARLAETIRSAAGGKPGSVMEVSTILDLASAAGRAVDEAVLNQGGLNDPAVRALLSANEASVMRLLSLLLNAQAGLQSGMIPEYSRIIQELMQQVPQAPAPQAAPQMQAPAGP